MLEVKHVEWHSETALSFYFGDEVDTEMVMEIAGFSEVVRAGLKGAVEVVPCGVSLYVEVHVLRCDVGAVEKDVYGLLDAFVIEGGMVRSERLIELPVYYDPEVAPDLVMLAEEKGLSVDEVVEMHCGVVYTVASLGFAPGFAYLSGLNPELATPRLSAPKMVAKGSLGIAGEQTAVYPKASPGGWVIVGNCPASLFDLEADPITEFEVGASVRFVPITRDEFVELGGVL